MSTINPIGYRSVRFGTDPKQNKLTPSERLIQAFGEAGSMLDDFAQTPGMNEEKLRREAKRLLLLIHPDKHIEAHQQASQFVNLFNTKLEMLIAEMKKRESEKKKGLLETIYDVCTVLVQSFFSKVLPQKQSKNKQPAAFLEYSTTR